MDAIIRNGFVIDGTGKPGFKTDIGIKKGKIAEIGNLQNSNAVIEMEAENKYVTPGFIDIHQHSDITLLAGPFADSSLKQGITTVIVGQCGHSAAPVKDKELIESHLYGYNPEWCIDINWTTIDEYLDKLESNGIGVNVGSLVGHGAIRLAVMGFADRLCTSEELNKMKNLLRDSLQRGALGFSTGLEYSPGKNADLNELIELNKIVAQEGKIYHTHIRNRENKLKEALQEAITTATETNVKIQISHLTPRFWASGESVKLIIELLEKARSNGIDVACDIYPYTFAAFTLGVFIPSWAYADGITTLRRYLEDPNTRKKMKEYKNQPLAYLANSGKWENLILCTSDANPDLIGKNFFEIAEIRHVDPHDALFDILLEEGKNFYNVLAYAITKKEEDIEEMLKYPYSVVMSDSYTLSSQGILKNTVMGPAAYSWTIHYLINYIKKKKVLTVHEAIRRITSLPAERVGITDRGIIDRGNYADLIILDYDNLKSSADLKNPNQYPQGIEYVFVNGEVVVKDSKYLNKNCGNIIKVP